MSTTITPDARAAWNTVERMRSTDPILAADLAALLREPRVATALRAIAEEGGYPGGLRSAEEAATQD